MKKGWLVAAIFLVGALVVIIIAAPRILNFTFEKATRLIEQNFVKKAPPEDEPRIRETFAKFIVAFKGNKIPKKDLDKLAKLTKSAYKDKELTQQEIEETLEFIETITPGFK